jgi:hypothetical protein
VAVVAALLLRGLIFLAELRPTAKHFDSVGRDKLSISSTSTLPPDERELSSYIFPPAPSPSGHACRLSLSCPGKFSTVPRHPDTMPATTTFLARAGSQLTSRGSIALRGSLPTSTRRAPALAALARYYASKCERLPSSTPPQHPSDADPCPLQPSLRTQWSACLPCRLP